MKAQRLLMPVLRLFFVAMLLLSASPLRAQLYDLKRATFSQLMEMAREFETKKSAHVAAEYYNLALKKAESDMEKGRALLGIGNNTPIREPNGDPKNDGVEKLAVYRKALDLTGFTGAGRTDVQLGIAQTQFELKQFEVALASVQPIPTSDSANPSQKIKALQWSGLFLHELKKFDEARATLTSLLATPNLPLEETVQAYQTVVRTYLAQNNTAAAQAELNKAASLPNLQDEMIARIRLVNGDFLVKEKSFALARSEFDKVAILADATTAQNVEAKMQTGSAYYEEKNYPSARDTWNQALAMRGGEAQAGNIWRAIGLAYSSEKNYPAAREAFNKWRTLPKTPLLTQLQAWETIASTYIEEKNYAGARETLENVAKLGEDNLVTAAEKQQLKWRGQTGIAQVYRAEGNFTQAALTYSKILDDAPVATPEPPYFAEARATVKKAADEMANDKASMDAAYTLYEKWEKIYPYEFNKAEANMAMGDILAAQGKKDEAKAKYQRVIELRKNYDDSKIAQKKIDALDGKPAA